MKNWLIKTAINLCGGISGLIEYACKWFTENVLSKIKDKDEFAAYADDVDQFGNFLEGCFNRHTKWLTEAKRAAANATIAAIRNLAAALRDCEITKDEIDAFVDAVVKAINAWKEAK